MTIPSGTSLLSHDSLPARIRRTADSSPNQVAFVGGSETATYEDLREHGLKLESHLGSRGFMRGDRVAIRLENKLEFAKTFFGCICAGAVAVPLDRPDDPGQQFVLDHTQARFLLHDDSLALDAAGYDGCQFIHATKLASASCAPVAAATDPSPDEPAVILYTSGTQGDRKGVLLTHLNVASVGQYVNEFMSYDDSAIEYVAAPLDHAFGFGRCRNILHAGATAVFDDGPFNPARLLQALETCGCNAISSVATGMAIMLQHFAEEFAVYGQQVRWIKMGSQGLDRAYKEQLCELFPDACLVQNYGLTEAQRTTLVDFNHDRAHLDTSGHPVGPTNLRIVDDDGSQVAPGTTGTIQISGPHVTPGYWRNEEITAQRLRDGWLTTDDTAFLDDDGYLHFVARKDDLVNVGGDKVSPLEVESLISDALADVTFVVCGMADPDGLLGEVLVVCIEQGDTEVKDWTSRRLQLLGKVPANRLPKLAFVFPRFPRTATGKVQRRKLRELLEAGGAVVPA